MMNSHSELIRTSWAESLLQLLDLKKKTLINPKKLDLLGAVWQIRIRDQVPLWPLDPGWVKSQDPDPG